MPAVSSAEALPPGDALFAMPCGRQIVIRAACRLEDVVTIVAADMRHWEAPQLADILVSELLGSFGDNELSPECLDGAQKFLKEGGVSIPQSYTSFLQPITTAKLWNDVKVSNHHKALRVAATCCCCF